MVLRSLVKEKPLAGGNCVVSCACISDVRRKFLCLRFIVKLKLCLFTCKVSRQTETAYNQACMDVSAGQAPCCLSNSLSDCSSAAWHSQLSGMLCFLGQTIPCFLYSCENSPKGSALSTVPPHCSKGATSEVSMQLPEWWQTLWIPVLLSVQVNSRMCKISLSSGELLCSRGRLKTVINANVLWQNCIFTFFFVLGCGKFYMDDCV